MKPTHDELLEKFQLAFPQASILLEDESHLHIGHPGAGHFRVKMIDDIFDKLQIISRHRLVYNSVLDWMPEQVHVLNIVTMTTEEVRKL